VTNITVEPVAGPVQSYTFPDLPPGDYQFRVRALFPDGVVGEWSHVLGATAEVLGTVGVSVSTGLPLPTVTAEVQGAAQVTITAGLPLPTVAAEVQGAAPPAEVTITAGLPLPTVAAEVQGAAPPAEVTITAGLPLPTVAAEVQGAAPPAEVTITAGLPLPTVAAEVQGAAEAVALAASTSVGDNDTRMTSIAVPLPAHTAGDLLVITLSTVETADVTPPSGWTLLASVSSDTGTGSGARQRTYWRTAGTSEPTSVTFALSANVRVGATAAALSGAGGFGTAGVGSAPFGSETFTIGPLTVPAGSLVLLWQSNYVQTAIPSGFTSPSGFATQAVVGAGGNFVTLQMDSATPSDGSTLSWLTTTNNQVAAAVVVTPT
jgi:hypothetical protein